MAQTIKLKRSAQSGASGIPSTSDLALGEVGINTYHGKMYIKKDDGTESIVEVGSTGSFLPLSGGTLTGGLSAPSLTVDNFTLDGTTLALSSGNMTLDSAGDILVDVDGGNHVATFNDNGLYLKTDTARLLFTEADGTNIAFVGDLTGSGQGGAFYYNHGGTATIQLKSYEASTIGHGLNVGGSVTSTTGFTTGANTRVQSSSGMLFVTGAAATVFEVGAGSEKMRLTSTGLGIGTTSVGTLHGASYGTTQLHIDGKTDRGQMIIEGDTLSLIAMSDNSATANSRVFLSIVNDGLMEFRSVNDNGTSKATIMSMTSAGATTFSGSVTSAGLPLNVNTSMYATDHSLSYYSSTNGVYLNGAGNSGWLRLNASGGSNDSVSHNLFGINAGNLQTFKTNSTLAMQIDGSQNVNIPNGGLMVGSTTAPSQALEIKKSGNSGNVALKIHNTGTATNDDALIGFLTEGNRNYSIGIHRDSGSFTLSNQDASVASGELLTIANSGAATFSSSVTSTGLEVNGTRYFDSDYNVTYYRKANHTTLGYQLHRDNGNSYYEWNTGGNHSHDFQFVSNNSQILNLATNGNVNIPNGSLMVGSTTAPVARLHTRDDTSTVYDPTAYQHDLFIEKRNTSGANQVATIRFGVTGYDGSTTAEASIGVVQTSNAHSGNIVFGTRHNGTRAERARLTSGGTLLVGTTSTTPGFANTNGHAFHVGDASHISRDQGTALVINRGTSDGGILQFRKSGTYIGGIESRAGVVTTLLLNPASGNGAGLSGGTKCIVPADEAGIIDNDISLGISTHRFKDLYLSNSAYVKNVGGVSDPDTYINFGDVANTTKFFTGGQEAFRIDASQNLLVGKTSADTYNNTNGVELQASGLITATRTGIAQILNREDSDGDIALFRRDGTTKGNISVSAYGMGFGGGTRSSDFFIKTDGTASFASGVNLGVGTSSPAYNTQILSGGDTVLSVVSGDSNSASLYLGDSVATRGRLTYNNANDSLAVYTDNNERCRLTSGGNLLIGKTADDDSTVGIRMQSTGHTSIVKSGGNCLTLNRLSSDGSILDFRKDTGTVVGSIGVNTGDKIYIGTGASGVGFSTLGLLPFNTSTNAFSNGSLDLGNGSFRWKDIFLSNDINVGNDIHLGNGSYLNFGDTGTSIYGSNSLDLLIFKTAGSEAARFDASRRFLVGGTSFGADGSFGVSSSGFVSQNVQSGVNFEIHSAGNSTIMDFVAIGTGTVGSISNTNSATAYNTSSDERLKDNIVDAPIASEDIDAIQVRSFDWKVDGEHQKYGMVAQELLEVAPDAVTQGDTPDDMMGVDYSKLVPMLIKEIQSLRQRVAQLEE